MIKFYTFLADKGFGKGCGKMRFCMIILSLVSSLFLLTGCGSPAEKENDIKVGTNAEFPPFEKLEGNGKITGFDAEILSAVAEGEDVGGGVARSENVGARRRARSEQVGRRRMVRAGK